MNIFFPYRAFLNTFIRVCYTVLIDGLLRALFVNTTLTANVIRCFVFSNIFSDSRLIFISLKVLILFILLSAHYSMHYKINKNNHKIITYYNKQTVILFQ